MEANDPGLNVAVETRPIEDAVEEEEAGYRFWPTHVLDQVIIFYLLGGLLITLAILLPFRLHEPADPLHTPLGIKPEWYFLPMYQAIKYVPKVLGIALTTLGAILILFWPFLDILIDRLKGPRFYRKIGVVFATLVLVLSGLGWVSERSFTVRGQKWDVDMLGIPHKAEPAPPHAAEGPPAEPAGAPAEPTPGPAPTTPPVDTGAAPPASPPQSTPSPASTETPSDTGAAPASSNSTGSGPAGGEQLGG